MKNNLQIGITIPNPCHEDWNTMSPQVQGKYCMVCSKVVFNFTQMSNNDIIQTIQTANSKICGRLDDQQLDSMRPKYQLPKKMKVFLYALAVAFLIEIPYDIIAQTQNDTNSSTLLQSGTIYGKVTDDKGQPLDFANVQVFDKGILVSGAKTDIYGNYKIKLIAPSVYLVKVTYLGYQIESVEKVKIQQNKLINLNFSLDKKSSDHKSTIGIIIYDHKLIDPSEPNKKVIKGSAIRNMGG